MIGGPGSRGTNPTLVEEPRCELAAGAGGFERDTGAGLLEALRCTDGWRLFDWAPGNICSPFVFTGFRFSTSLADVSTQRLSGSYRGLASILHGA